MTWLNLLVQGRRLIYNNPTLKTVNAIADKENADVKVFFDFPLHGVKRFYTISAITDEGIMLRNDEVERPLGHE